MAFNNQWESYPASKRIQATGGLATSRARGAMAETWWSKRFVSVLESFGLGGRMTRGRTYARAGQVLSLEVNEGLLVAQVQGSRRTPYAVTVRLQTPTPTQWSKISDELKSRLGYAARLLAGEVPTDLEEVFTSAAANLFPKQWRDLRATCSCPDWGDPCKHQAAVLYVFADQLDRDPWMLLQWLGRSKADILELFAGSQIGGNETPEVAPWWPLRVDASNTVAGTPMGASSLPVASTPVVAHAVLDRLGPLDGDGSVEALDSLRELYRLIAVPETVNESV
jgi:uncharacterized Zn finger protein